MNDDVFVERVRNKSMEKIQDPAGIRTQDLLNTSQTLLPSQQKQRPGAEDKLHKQHCLEASAKFQLKKHHSIRIILPLK